jgi:hypothetical protein
VGGGQTGSKYLICLYENSIMKPMKNCKTKGDDRERRKSRRGGEFDQGTLHTCMEISQ